jgi:NTP pyrophosphatase (non-canonical NTP hydrolase)
MDVPSKKQEDFVIIYEMALALERRFPANNSVFSYGTRLCEETGELAEVLNEIQNEAISAERKHHLVKEVEDVLQIIQGVLGIYSLNDQLPVQLEDYFAQELTAPTKNDIVTLSIVAGRFADAINHMESQGVKKNKHGERPEIRLTKSAFRLTSIVVSFLRSYGALSDFRAQISEDRARLPA